MAKKKEDQANQKSYEDLEAELNELKNLVKSLVSSKQTEVVLEKDVHSLPKLKIQPLQEEYSEVSPNKRIKIISLFDGILVLTTGQYGQGKPYTFNKYGETKNIIYSDLSEILHYQNRFAEMGLFYICDDNVISNHGLYDSYQKLLSKEIIDNLLDYNRQEMNELFKNSTDMQKEQIASIIARKIANEEDVDLNKVDVLSKLYGHNITNMAENYKQIKVS
jgi:hypothetical protein